jgi:hypothetical protein
MQGSVCKECMGGGGVVDALIISTVPFWVQQNLQAPTKQMLAPPGIWTGLAFRSRVPSSTAAVGVTLQSLVWCMCCMCIHSTTLTCVSLSYLYPQYYPYLRVLVILVSTVLPLPACPCHT